MKVAIIGSGLTGIESALHFFELGAHVTLYGENLQGGSLFDYKDLEIEMNKSWRELCSTTGLQVLSAGYDRFKDESFLSTNPTYKDFYQKYVQALLEYLRPCQRKFKVKRIHKRFLNQTEEIEGRSRFLDLFRVVFDINPEDSVERQQLASEEAFQNLSPEQINSLKNTIEFYDDVDIVVNTSGEQVHCMGPAGELAINEQHNRDENVFYGSKGLNSLEKIKSSKQIVFVGTEELTDVYLSALNTWLKEKGHKAFVVTDVTSTVAKESLKNVQEFVDKDFQQQIEVFHTEMDKWKALEDYERVKVPKPIEPERKLILLPGHNIISFDKLVDQPGIFLTAEGADFRGEDPGLKTLKADTVIVTNGRSGAGLNAHSLQDNEKGYFKITGNDHILGVNNMMSEINKLFSRAE